MSAESLERALHALGCGGRVEARGKLAVFTTEDLQLLADARVRDDVLRAAAEHGFTNIAVELNEHADAAAVHRAEPSA